MGNNAFVHNNGHFWFRICFSSAFKRSVGVIRDVNIDKIKNTHWGSLEKGKIVGEGHFDINGAQRNHLGLFRNRIGLHLRRGSFWYLPQA